MMRKLKLRGEEEEDFRKEALRVKDMLLAEGAIK